MLESITQISLFQDLGTRDINRLNHIFTVEHFVQDQLIFQQESKAEYFYILLQGKVVIRYKPYDGPPLVIARIAPGGVFGWSAMLHRDVYTSDAVADVSSQAYRARGQELLDFCAKSPDSGAIILQRLAHAISERLEGSHTEILKLFRSGMDLTNECWKRMMNDE